MRVYRNPSLTYRLNFSGVIKIADKDLTVNSRKSTYGYDWYVQVR